ncbi:hypothetical protein HOP51_20010 [Halomonas sp. MCCC 1A11036]|uniref:Uncharacterized protein n=1 Tax=Billgrantia zhangzhouensis TaxID=2733481 RepID=A0ABS9AL95_9GAMM|nr:hypothetical protein [Halomonas zhangzhouensis]MCE8022373.1 hypothetical protein [Halomonas zhangzhouensis]
MDDLDESAIPHGIGAIAKRVAPITAIAANAKIGIETTGTAVTASSAYPQYQFTRGLGRRPQARNASVSTRTRQGRADRIATVAASATLHGWAKVKGTIVIRAGRCDVGVDSQLAVTTISPVNSMLAMLADDGNTITTILWLPPCRADPGNAAQKRREL